MTPIEKMRAEMEAERAAKNAKRALMDDLMSAVLSSMPDGTVKRNGQILLTHSKISSVLEKIARRAAKGPDEHYNAEQSQQVLDYLTCVYGGLCEFCKQIGVEVPDGAS